jgi:hypothetical protein
VVEELITSAGRKIRTNYCYYKVTDAVLLESTTVPLGIELLISMKFNVDSSSLFMIAVKVVAIMW